jgi:hypothetical protein
LPVVRHVEVVDELDAASARAQLGRVVAKLDLRVCEEALGDASSQQLSRTPHAAHNLGLEPAFPLVVAPVPLPVSWTHEGDTNIAPPSSIVDPDATVRSRFIGQAAAIARRAPAGVWCPRRSISHSVL